MLAIKIRFNIKKTFFIKNTNYSENRQLQIKINFLLPVFKGSPGCSNLYLKIQLIKMYNRLTPKQKQSYTGPMKSTRRIQSCGPRRPTDRLQISQSQQIEPKSSRYLHYAFASNLNHFIKTHKSILGDIDFANKVKLSREEMDEVEDIGVEKLYKTAHAKIGKDQTYRNQTVKKGRDQYYRGYCEHHGKTNEIDLIMQIEDESVNTECILYSSNHLKSSNSTTSQSPRRRPQSSRQSVPLSITAFSCIPSMFQNKSLLLQMKTITSNMFEKGKSMQFSLGGLGGASEVLQKKQDNERVVFHGERVIIDTKRDKINISASSKYNKKISYRHQYRKSIDDIQKEQIQNKIGLVNSILSVSLPISQGYKPKTKCWQNFFI